MTRTDAVLFDLDETLLDRTGSLRLFLADQHARFGHRLGAPDYKAWETRFIVLDARGSVHKSKVYPALLREFAGDERAAGDLLEDYLENCCGHARPFDGMADVLRALRERGKRLAIVTNGESAFQRKHITALGLEPLVDEILISGEEDLRKPDPALFLRAAARLGAGPARCLFVGDNPAADILGAAAAGMRTAWFRCGQQWPEYLPPNPGAVVDGLAEIPGLLQPDSLQV